MKTPGQWFSRTGLRLRIARLLAATLLLAWIFAPPAGGQQPEGLLLGEQVVLDSCLRLSVLSINDRHGGLNRVDWVTVHLKNECKETRRHLLVELTLFDPLGKGFPSRVWMLARGERLRPGKAKTENFPIPDPDNLMPSRWSARLVYVEAQRLPGSKKKGASVARQPKGR